MSRGASSGYVHVDRRGRSKAPLRFDIRSFLDRYAGRVQRSGHNHVNFDCWACGKPGHLYVNVETGCWDCKRCGLSGGPIDLVKEVARVSRVEARRLIVSETLPYIPHMESELRERLEARKRKPPRETVDTPLPEDFIPCCSDDGKVHFPRYLRSRGVTVQELREFGIGYCLKGEYANRIVFPVESPLGQSFTTRAAVSGMIPRYLGGEGVGRLLFGWNVAVRIGPPFVIVEGPPDALAVYRAGYAAIGLMGKTVRESQRIQLQSLVGDKVFLLDPDASDEAAGQAAKLGDASVAFLVGGDDPAASTRKRIVEAVQKALPLSRARAQSMRQRLDAFKKRHP